MINVVGRDIFLNCLGFVLLILILILPYINDPKKDTPNPPPPGNLSVLACWPQGAVDVDVWGTAPGQKIATGYSHRQGFVLSLLRDDLGTTNDASPINCENMFARETPAGEWAFNLHCFACSGPATVYVEVALGRSAAGMSLIFKGSVTIKPKEERTVIRFRLDGKGQIVPGSVHHVYRPLREAGK